MIAALAKADFPSCAASSSTTPTTSRSRISTSCASARTATALRAQDPEDDLRRPRRRLRRRMQDEVQPRSALRLDRPSPPRFARHPLPGRGGARYSSPPPLARGAGATVGCGSSPDDPFRRAGAERGAVRGHAVPDGGGADADLRHHERDQPGARLALHGRRLCRRGVFAATRLVPARPRRPRLRRRSSVGTGASRSSSSARCISAIISTRCWRRSA